MSGKVVAVVQARTASTRLPGKVLADIVGEPMLVRVVDRARMAKTMDELVVATTDDDEDDPIAQLCEDRGYPVYRGSRIDVLDRVYRAARARHTDVVVRLTGDCPLIDAGLIDYTVTAYLEADPPIDFAANRLPYDKTYPVGTDTEVCSFHALERAWREADQPHEREHVMPYLYEEPGRFETLLVRGDQDYSHFRWTVDTPEDLELVRRVFAHFEGRQDFTWIEVLELFDREPELVGINSGVEHKSQFDIDPDWGR
ncbi:MAG: cytidylyltransferase domain-containing protein [Anaerolineales bacterium]